MLNTAVGVNGNEVELEKRMITEVDIWCGEVECRWLTNKLRALNEH